MKNIIIILLISLLVFSIFYKRGPQQPSFRYIHDTIEKEIEITKTILKLDTIKEKEISFLSNTITEIDTQIIFQEIIDNCNSYTDQNYINLLLCNDTLSLQIRDTVSVLVTGKRKIPIIGKKKFTFETRNVNPYIKTNINIILNERNRRRLFKFNNTAKQRTKSKEIIDLRRMRTK